jgi:hypothetical protein
VSGPAGVYNIVDDCSVRFSDWLPAFANALDAKAPMRVPLWLARLAAGNAMVTWTSTLKGASNARARSQLGWSPTFCWYREGFCWGLTEEARAQSAAQS